jgi:hypothetical protein
MQIASDMDLWHRRLKHKNPMQIASDTDMYHRRLKHKALCR